MDKVAEIKKIKELLDSGAITHEEFKSLKKQVIDFRENQSEDEVTTTQLQNKSPVKEDIATHSANRDSTNQTQKESFSRFDKDEIGNKDIKVTRQVEYEPGNKTSRRFFRSNIVLSIILGLTILGSIDSFIVFFLITGAGIGLSFIILRILNRQTRNTVLVSFTCLLLSLIFVPNYNTTSAGVSSNVSSSRVDDMDAAIRSFLTDNIFVNYGSGGDAYLRFDGSRGGWYGLATLTFGGCDFIYNYETKGNRVDLKFNYTFCPGFQGGRATIRVNQNLRSFTLIFQGQELVFRPL